MNAVLKPGGAFPMSAMRPSETGRIGRRKTTARLDVEAALRATPAGLSPMQLVLRCGVALHEVRRILVNVVNARDAHNINEGSRGAAVYVWGPTPSAPISRPALASKTTEHYDGAELRPYTGRPGAVDAFSLPSIQNGERIQRRAPIIIGAQPEGKRR